MVQFKSPLTSTTSATDTVAVLCHVQEIDTSNLIASVIDQVGTPRKVSMKALPGKSTEYPAVGESWVISREYGDWMFIASVNVVPKLNGVGNPTSAATPSSLVSRDTNARAQFADPSDPQDAATKAYVDASVHLNTNTSTTTYLPGGMGLFHVVTSGAFMTASGVQWTGNYTGHAGVFSAIRSVQVTGESPAAVAWACSSRSTTSLTLWAGWTDGTLHTSPGNFDLLVIGVLA